MRLTTPQGGRRHLTSMPMDGTKYIQSPKHPNNQSYAQDTGQHPFFPPHHNLFAFFSPTSRLTVVGYASFMTTHYSRHRTPLLSPRLRK
eukprot:scaffold8309_cov67-Attheya_sp.AAC.1